MQQKSIRMDTHKQYIYAYILDKKWKYGLSARGFTWVSPLLLKLSFQSIKMIVIMTVILNIDIDICMYIMLCFPLCAGWPQANPGRTPQKIWNRLEQGEQPFVDRVCVFMCLRAHARLCLTPGNWPGWFDRLCIVKAPHRRQRNCDGSNWGQSAGQWNSHF